MSLKLSSIDVQRFVRVEIIPLHDPAPEKYYTTILFGRVFHDPFIGLRLRKISIPC